MTHPEENIWDWNGWEVSWSIADCNPQASIATVLIHGFGACKEHWRFNQPELAKLTPCYAIDLIGFGDSSQPKSRLKGESNDKEDFAYEFDSWANQVAGFCQEVVKKPVLLVGNSIGGVIALRTSQLLAENCCGVVLIDCAQRTMDDKRLKEQGTLMRLIRPWLKQLVRQRWLSKNLFRNAAHPAVIKQVLKQAYPSGANVDDSLVNLLKKPSQRPGASEAFRGFINLFDDHLAPELLPYINVPVDLIWGESDPWEPVEEARAWALAHKCIRSLEVIDGAGHCPHDEAPAHVNRLLKKVIQQAT